MWKEKAHRCRGRGSIHRGRSRLQVNALCSLCSMLQTPVGIWALQALRSMPVHPARPSGGRGDCGRIRRVGPVLHPACANEPYTTNLGLQLLHRTLNKTSTSQCSVTTFLEAGRDCRTSVYSPLFIILKLCMLRSRANPWSLYYSLSS